MKNTYTAFLRCEICLPFFLINHKQKQVLLIKESSFFEAQKNVCHIHNIVSIFDQRYETQR